jgi:hypothetical protein
MLLGIDPADPLASRDWTLMSHYPGEHEDKERLRYARELAYTDFDNFFFHQADFGELDIAELYKKFPALFTPLEGDELERDLQDEPGHIRTAVDKIKDLLFRNNEQLLIPQIDTMFANTWLYQLPADERSHMIDKTIAMATEFAVVQDNCVVNVRDRTKLIFPSDWQSVPYCYRTYVWDKRAANPEWQELFMSPTSRANTVRIGPAEFIDCYGESVRAWDVIDSAT